MRWFALIAAATVMIPWQIAEACSPAFDTPEVTFPVDGSIGVPTNVVLWATRTFGLVETPRERVVFVADGGTVIESELRELAGGLLVARPLVELAPNTRYTARACTTSECPVDLQRFTTGSGPSAEPPELPIEHGRDLDTGRAPCGGRFRSIALDIEFDGVLVLDLGLPQLDEGTLDGDLDLATTQNDEHVVIDRDSISVTRDHVEARMGVFDEAGSFSGWVELEPLDFTGCGCTSSRGTGGAALSWLSLLLAVARRRRS